MHRRLAAILSADLVGYSRLVSEDEAGTRERLRMLGRELIEPAVAAHEGRIVKPMADGLLAEFVSAVEAARCAVEIQRALATRYGAFGQGALSRLRIGVNLGHVFTEGGDMRGDGVTIAAGVMDLAEPGGICITSTVLPQVRNRIDVAFEDLGEIEIENVPQPVHVFRVLLDADAVGRQAPGAGVKPWYRQWSTLILVLAVLAFLVSAGLRLFAHNPVIEPVAPEPTDAPPAAKP
jgi:adenylate cyclase